MYLIATTRQERDRIVKKMMDATGYQPSIFIDGNTWRIQDNRLGWIWVERELPEYAQ